MLLLLAGVSVYAQNNVIDEVVWVVGDDDSKVGCGKRTIECSV